MKSEMKMPRDRYKEVKCKKNSREFSRNKTPAGYWLPGDRYPKIMCPALWMKTKTDQTFTDNNQSVFRFQILLIDISTIDNFIFQHLHNRQMKASITADNVD